MYDYWRFCRQELPLLGFGFSLTFFSSFGQSFLISLFVPFFLADFSLSNTEFGTLYSVATLGSALLLPWTGHRMDRTGLGRFTLTIVLLGGFSALLLASSNHLIVLFLGLLGMRFAGPGLASYTAMAAMARYYFASRGKALSISSLGFPAGEAVLPLLGTLAIAGLGWRSTWLLIGLVSLFLFAPLLRALLVRSGVDQDGGRDVSGDPAATSPVAGSQRDPQVAALEGWEPPPSSSASAGSKARGTSRDWNRREMLGDSRFWLLLPAALLPAFWATGIFLYQTSIAGLKGWSIPVMASAFTAFALARIAVSLVAGGLVDRFSARHVFPFSLVPMGVGLALLIPFEGLWVPYAFMACLGMTTGMSGNVRSALWAELYGVRHLGSIKSLLAALTAVSTAASPVVVGIVLDAGESLDGLLWAGVSSVAVGILLALTLYPRSSAARPL